MTILASIKKLVPSEVISEQRAVASAWERFVGTGELQNINIRPVIANSWLRCKELGINPQEDCARSVISIEEIDEKLYREHLGQSGKAVLDKMAQVVRDTGHVIVLADHTGKIIYSVGHKQVQNHLEKINFRPGSEWHEDVVGPNGIGTPLAIGHADFVMGSEHFCQGWQPWVCYGAPIHHPGNQSIIGCIDITGPAASVSVEAMALAISIAHSVETNLATIQLKKRENLRNYYRSTSIKYPNEASMVIDEFGYIIDINSHAHDLLIFSSSVLLQTPVNMIFPKFWDDIKESIGDSFESELDIKLNSQNEVIPCVIKPIEIDTFKAGWIVLFTSNIQNITKSLRDKEDELIRKTLEEAEGNVSKAARLLNINRSTIYRRKKLWQE